MPTHLVYNPENFRFDLHEFDGENIEWSWKYNCSKVQIWSENADGDWIRSAAQITYAANEMYPNRPPNHGLKRFFYQTLDWHWSEADRALRRGNQPPYYVSCGDLARSTTELSLDDNVIPRRSLEEELEDEESYHQNKLQLNAIDAILHKVALETKAWLNGGPRPQRRVLMSPRSCRYRTRGTTRSIEAQCACSSRPSSFQPSSSRVLPPRVLLQRRGLDPSDLVAIEDSDSD